MTRNKNRLFGRHFETVQHFMYLFVLFYFILFYFILFYFNLFYFNLFYLFAELWGFFMVHTYMVHIFLLQNPGGKVIFLRGVHGTPLGTNGSESTLVP